MTAHPPGYKWHANDDGMERKKDTARKIVFLSEKDRTGILEGACRGKAPPRLGVYERV